MPGRWSARSAGKAEHSTAGTGVSGLASNRPAPSWRERAHGCSCEGPVRHGIRPRHHRGAAAAAATGRALPPAPFALHGAVITPDGAWSSGYVTVAAGEIDARRQEQADRRARGRDRRGHPARAPRPARAPGVQRLRRLGAAEALCEPVRVAALQALPGAGPRPAEPAADAGAAQDPDALRRGARPRRGRHGHPGCVRREQRVVGAARAQHRPVGLRGAPGAVDDRPAVGVLRAAELRGRDEADHGRRRQRLLPAPVRGQARRCA